ncbi:MAG: hypothetical protein ABR548_05175 [Actinomycetota bacterium]
MGCVVENFGGDGYWCLAAYQHGGTARIVVAGRATKTTIGPVSEFNFYREEASFSADAISSFVSTTTGQPSIRIQVTLPITGAIDLFSTSYRDYYTSDAENACLNSHLVWFAIRSDTGDRTIGNLTHDSGTVGGVSVVAQPRLCNSFFVGPVSGVWAVHTIHDQS